MILFKDGQKVIILIHKFAINFSSEIKHEYIKNDFIFFSIFNHPIISSNYSHLTISEFVFDENY